MAQKYVRIYTYTGQPEWTTAERGINMADFTVSGDTDREMAEIVGIYYGHNHSSHTSREWTLTGRLFFQEDGGTITTIDSDAVTKQINKNTVVNYLNTFTTLPTPDQFARCLGVATLDDSGSPADNGNLTWVATSTRAVQLIVEFYDQPPTRYAPKIESFSVERVTEDNQPSREGTHIATTLRLSISSEAPLSEATLKLRAEGVEGSEIDLSDRIPYLIGEGAALDTSIIPGEYSAGKTWYFTLEFAIGKESDAASAQAFRAKAPIHITNNGVAFGGFSSATEDDPKEEFHNPVIFHKGFAMGNGGSIQDFIGIQHGYAANLQIAAGGSIVHPVYFGTTYAQTPNIILTFDSTEQNLDRNWDTLTLTTAGVAVNGFAIRIRNGSSSAITTGVHWVAFGIPTVEGAQD